MSLAMYAAPFDNDSNNNKNNDTNDTDNKKKQLHNRTQKRYPNVKEGFNNEKVNSVLQSIHNNSNVDDEDNLGDFNPPPKPESSGVFKTVNTETNLVMGNNVLSKSLGLQPLPNYGDSSENLDLNNFNTNYGDNKTVDEYYKKYIPNYNSNNRLQMNIPIPKIQDSFYQQSFGQGQGQGQGQGPVSTSYLENDILLQKLNYMINLLEEKQDEKTNNVTEEIILYSFLGIFIIFIVDSFARVGKYVR